MNKLEKVAIEFLKQRKNLLDLNEDDMVDNIVNSFEVAKLFLSYSESLKEFDKEI